MIKNPVYLSNDIARLEKIYTAYFNMLSGVLPFETDVIQAAQKSICNSLKLSDCVANITIASARDRENRDNAMNILKESAPDVFSYLCGGKDGTEILPEKLAALLNYLPGRDDELDQLPPIENRDDAKKLRSCVFRYDLLTQGSTHNWVYMLSDVLGSTVCPYCNRAFTNTIRKTRNRKFVSRPELDHYKPKRRYPFFAVSLRNLIPCCHMCNRVKGIEEGHLNPYLEGIGNDGYFWMESNDIGYLTGELRENEEVSIKCVIKESVEDKRKARLKKSKKIFGWEEQYDSNKDFALRIFHQRYIFNDECLEMMLSAQDLFCSKEYLRSLLFLRSVEEDDWGDYPMSKFVHDMNAQFDYIEEE